MFLLCLCLEFLYLASEQNQKHTIQRQLRHQLPVGIPGII